MSGKRLSSQIHFGPKDRYRYKKVIDFLYSEKIPERMRSYVAKELMLLGVNTGVPLEKILTGEGSTTLSNDIPAAKTSINNEAESPKPSISNFEEKIEETKFSPKKAPRKTIYDQI